MHVFDAGKGINKNKINENFTELQTGMNANETQLTEIDNTALRKDGSNLTQAITNKFREITPNVLNTSGTINLSDNSVNFLNPTGEVTIVLPDIAIDELSHTIILIVQGSDYSLTTQTSSGATITKHLYNDIKVDTTNTYSLMYIYNKIDKTWYYSLTQ